MRHTLHRRQTLAIITCLICTAVGWLLYPYLVSPNQKTQQDQSITKTEITLAPSDAELATAWHGDILPLLEHYCYDCHGDGRSKGKLDLEEFPNLATMRANPKIWEHILSRVDYHLMPPPKEEQPTREERNKLITWINDAIFPIDPLNPDPGHIVIRRLNRNEYQNTIRDLLGVDINYSNILPPDDSGYGFDNIGSVLSISPAHIETYLLAAEKALDKALVIGPMQAPTTTFDPRKLQGDGNRSQDGIFLWKRGTVKINHTTRHPGDYTLRISASAHQAGNDPAFMDVRLNGKPVLRFKVQNQFGDQKTFTTTLKLPHGHSRLSISFPNDYYNAKHPDPKKRDRNLMIHSIRLQGPTNQHYEKPDTHKRIFIPRKKGSTDHDYTREVLSRFAHRAFRRPVSSGEITRYLTLAKNISKTENSLDLGIKGALQAMLVSPSFLFIGTDTPNTTTRPSLISEHTLASRLSYFLWSSTPDDTLLDLADRSQLRDQLDQQVLRMLKDNRASEMIRHFTGQWLQLRDLAVITPDLKRFPVFTDDLRSDMRTETEMLANHILRGNRSLLEFLDADYSFLNDRLARHYGIKGINGHQFRRIKLPTIQENKTASTRRGILTHASILTLTSQPTRTSPVLRGKFVLENILDITPPPPPPNLPQLEDPTNHSKRMTLREQLALHRKKTSCAGCHNLMDPVGLALGHFDAIGRFREFDNGHAIDASGQLVTGEQINNAESLRHIISTGKKDEFIRCLTRKMLTYALGRGVTRYDRLTVKDIMRNIEKNNYNSHSLILGIIHSTPFQYQRPSTSH